MRYFHLQDVVDETRGNVTDLDNSRIQRIKFFDRDQVLDANTFIPTVDGMATAVYFGREARFSVFKILAASWHSPSSTSLAGKM